jgi:predicted metalloprotease
MQWKGRRQSRNVEDQRGRGGSPGGFGRGGGFRVPIGRAGGGGVSGVIILVVLFFGLRALGVDPSVLLGEDSSPAARAPQTQESTEMTQFVSTVLAETEDAWSEIFSEQGLRYDEPTLVLFSGRVDSACGFASSASGPFYCPGDGRVYLDTSFFAELETRFDAAGDFAAAYVIAHEVGHHVQNLIGVLPRFNAARRTMSAAEANRMSVRVELQADCFAGVWGHHAGRRNLLEEGDVEEALNAATQIGDDTLQRRTQGYVVPESFNHGTSEQRRTWFARQQQRHRQRPRKAPQLHVRVRLGRLHVHFASPFMVRPAGHGRIITALCTCGNVIVSSSTVHAPRRTARRVDC